MHALAASGTTELQTFTTGIIPVGWRFTFTGPGGETLNVPLVPYSTSDPVQITSPPVPVAGDWTCTFSAVDSGGLPVGAVVSATATVPADVMLRVAKGLTLQVVTGV